LGLLPSKLSRLGLLEEICTSFSILYAEALELPSTLLQCSSNSSLCPRNLRRCSNNNNLKEVPLSKVQLSDFVKVLIFMLLKEAILNQSIARKNQLFKMDHNHLVIQKSHQKIRRETNHLIKNDPNYKFANQKEFRTSFFTISIIYPNIIQELFNKNSFLLILWI